MTAAIIHHLKKASTKTPSACAIISGDKRCTYAELDQWSDQVANSLKHLGVTSGEKVALYLDKSLQAIVCLYGIMKAGACYVPMSPADPVARTAYMLNNSQARFIVIARQIDPQLDAAITTLNVTKVEVSDLYIEAQVPLLEMKSTDFSPDQIAAVLHTSGSTGSPKGVMITHGNLSVFVDWASNAFKLNKQDCLLSHAPLQFDLSFFDLFCATTVGAACVLAQTDDTANANRLAKLVNDTGVTIWQSVPSALTLQTLSGSGISMPSVRHVLFAGEPMPKQTLQKLPCLFPSAKLHNIYGCTETNDTFMYSLPDNISDTPDPMPIGKVLPHIRYRITDAEGQAVAKGEQGHLLVKGSTVMAGYLGLPPQTGKSDGYYLTNDMVSEDGQGLLHFHGRIDSVIKTNGYRVNLTEIEECLLRSCQFQEVALFCVKDDAIGNRMVAAVRPVFGVQFTVLKLKTYCAHELPKYAIPHNFYITEEELPKGTTGKIDRPSIKKLWLDLQATKKNLPLGEVNYEHA